MMDCDTTGVEPDFSLVKSKKLVGGGEITIVNKTVPLGSSSSATRRARSTRSSPTSTSATRVVGAPYVKTEHFPVFDCAIGERAVHYSGHVKMMGAMQPFISGAISKTVNMPESVTVERRRAGVHRRVEARREGDRDLPRQLQGRPAALGQGRKAQGMLAPRVRPPRRRSARGGGCRTTAPRSAASSASASTRATSTSASSTTARRATSSSTSPRRARPSPA